MTTDVPVEAQACLFAFVCLVIGGIFRELNKHTNLPYTPALLIFGIFMGIIAPYIGLFGDIMIKATDLDPDGIIILFIPILIFESAMNTQWHIFKKSLSNILMLSGPGVAYNILFLGACSKLFLAYDEGDFDWISAMILSAIISTTDPVAVISLLRAVGSPVYFNTLVEGESLLNDAFSILFFLTFTNLSKGQSLSFGLVIESFFLIGIGGLLIGAAFGFVGTLWLRKIIRDETLIICLTFCMCYLCFYFAEYSDIGSSGILAVVGCGLFLAVFGKTNIDHRVEDSLEAVWGFLQWVCETLIFLLGGIITGYLIFHDPNSQIDALDWIRMFGLYILVVISRLVVIFSFYPILSKTGYGMNWREGFILGWGGLRGSMSIALALVFRAEENMPLKTRQLIVFNSAGVATLTMLINATTAGYLIRKLKVVSVPATKAKIKVNLQSEIRQKAVHKLEEIRHHKYNQLCDWDEVKTLVGIDEKQMTELAEKVKAATRVSYILDNDILAETRFRLLRIIRRMFWERYQKGQLTSAAITLLLDACDAGLDKTYKSVWLWEYIYADFLGWRRLGLVRKLSRIPVIGIYPRKLLANYISRIYQVTTTFIMVSDEVINGQQGVKLSKKHFKTIIEELKSNSRDANNYLVSVQDDYQDAIKTIQMRRAALQILHYQAEFLEEARKECQIEEKEYKEIRGELDQKAITAQGIQVEFNSDGHTFDDLVLQFPSLAVLKKTHSVKLRAAAQTISLKPAEIIYHQGNPIEYFYVVTNGVVKEYEGDDHINGVYQGIGSLLSFATLVEPKQLALKSCMTVNQVSLRRIPIALMVEAMRENPEFELIAYQNALPGYVRSSYTNCQPLAALTEQELLDCAQKTKLLTLYKGEKSNFEYGAVLFDGTLLCSSEKQALENEEEEEEKLSDTVEPVTYLRSGEEEYEALTDCKILVFLSEVASIEVPAEEVRKKRLTIDWDVEPPVKIESQPGTSLEMTDIALSNQYENEKERANSLSYKRKSSEMKDVDLSVEKERLRSQTSSSILKQNISDSQVSEQE